jgi:putative addiction module component (TIGR02574 family)
MMERPAMSDLVAELAERGRSLAPADRARLVEMLLESLREPPISEIEEAWNREIERRVATHERGEVEVVAYIRSPRLARPEQAALFEKEVVEGA